ncbi:membrane protein implicated in regulation of membrane protease activity [Natronospira proteinivora]|uniref:Membrane protein implicated in regulation of membrane protease activity n=1 Tax=Natronospira proteinivora TaxID=1807133 RepID=A0ABT1G8W5_9GAMM|nr:NfeD family protein [Natronospira proteinivora]MCP1727766.1 membrane protein implicated in regulation of membrane protease activity [Natronospira proteinivora]
MATLLKYCLLQIPGLLLFGLILYILVAWDWVSLQLAGILLLVWLIKDALLYPVYRPALEGGQSAGAHALVGLTGKVRTELDPQGLVEVAGERWQARKAGEQAIPAGARVRVIAAHGMVLTVRPVESDNADYSD